MNIYLVAAGNGEYSGYEERTICAVSTREKADEMVSKLDELKKHNNEFHKKLIAFSESNPIRDIGPEPTRPRPADNYGELVEACVTHRATDEQKKLYRQLQAEHQKNIDAFNILYNQWIMDRNQASDERWQRRLDWFKANYSVPEHLEEVRTHIKYDGDYYNDEHFFVHETNLL